MKTYKALPVLENETHTETPDDSEDDSQLENKIQELIENLTAYSSDDDENQPAA